MDFGEAGATKFAASVCGNSKAEGVIQLRIDRLMGEVIGYLTVPVGDEESYLTFFYNFFYIRNYCYFFAFVL